MGTNVIYLADLAAASSLPAYRRARRPAPVPARASVSVPAPAAMGAPDQPAPAAATPPASWAAAAQRRAALRLARSHPTAAPSTATTLRPAQQPLFALSPVGADDTATHNAATHDAASSHHAPPLRLKGRLADVCAELDRLVQAEAMARRA